MTHRTKLIGFTAGSVVALGVITLVFALQGYGGVVGFLSAQTFPSELRTARFVSTDGTYYGWTALGFNKVTPEGIEEVRRIMAQHPNVSTLIAPSVSPDTSMLAYVSVEEGIASIRILGPDVAERSVGEGTGPFFVTNTTLGRFTDNGLVLSDLNGSTSDEIVALSRTLAPTFIQYDASSQLLAIQEGESRIGVYRIDDRSARSIGAYIGDYASFEITDTTLYVVRKGGNGMEILGAAISADMVGEARILTTFPDVLAFVAFHI